MRKLRGSVARLNAIEGVSANVGEEGKATVSYDRKISDAQLRQAVEATGVMSATSAHKESGPQIRFLMPFGRGRFRAHEALRKCA
ncbi:MAG: heavy-metal-associated domain-containing protein [Merdibacter sp.]